MDGNVQFKATSIEAGKVPFTEVNIHAKLNDGVLALDPVQFQMPEGRLSAVVNIDTRKDVPLVRLELARNRCQPCAIRLIRGPMGRRSAACCRPARWCAVKGDSVHNLMADATAVSSPSYPMEIFARLSRS